MKNEELEKEVDYEKKRRINSETREAATNSLVSSLLKQPGKRDAVLTMCTAIVAQQMPKDLRKKLYEYI